MKQALFAWLALPLCGCATFQPGRLQQKIVSNEFVQSGDTLFFNSPAGYAFEMSLLDKKAKPIFNQKRHVRIVDVASDGNRLLVQTNPLHDDDSGLFVYDRVGGTFREVPAPKLGRYFDHAVFSKSGKQIAASASTPDSYSHHTGKDPLRDDRIYIIDVQTFHITELKNGLGRAEVGEIVWDVSGDKVYNSALDTTTKDWDYVRFERDIHKNTVKRLGSASGKSQLPHIATGYYRSQPQRIQCGGKTVGTDDAGSMGGSSYTARVIVSQGKQSQAIATIHGRKLAWHSATIPLSPEFTSDCNYIVYRVGKEIYVTDSKGSQTALLAEGESAHLM